MMKPRGRFALSLVVALVGAGLSPLSANADPFKLGIEERGYLQDPNGGGEMQYPMPQAVPTQQPLNGNVEQQQRPKPPKKQAPKPPQQQRPPLQVGIQKTQELPQGFMGRWMVMGTRQQVQAAQPDFQATANQAFAGQTQNVWTITGNPSSGYSFANDQGVKSAIFVDKVQGDTAFIRYQHQIKNTMAQEAIVMQIAPGGAQFSGLERISIVKPGEPQPRCKVTYQLTGRRQ